MRHLLRQKLHDRVGLLNTDHLKILLDKGLNSEELLPKATWKALVEDPALPDDLIVELLQAYHADELLAFSKLPLYKHCCHLYLASTLLGQAHKPREMLWIDFSRCSAHWAGQVLLVLRRSTAFAHCRLPCMVHLPASLVDAVLFQLKMYICLLLRACRAIYQSATRVLAICRFAGLRGNHLPVLVTNMLQRDSAQGKSMKGSLDHFVNLSYLFLYATCQLLYVGCPITLPCNIPKH